VKIHIILNALADEEYLKTMQERLQQLPLKNPFLYTEEDIIDYGFSLGITSY